MRRLVALGASVVVVLLALASPAAARRPDVVFLVFDEFPADTLIGPGGRIDAGRFPGFSALARTSTWYPNATTVEDATTMALPAILDARRPRRSWRPNHRYHPNNLFTLLGRRGYGMRVVEEDSSLCPYRSCRRRRLTQRGFFTNIWSGRGERAEATIDSIGPRRRPTLWFHHVALPHSPWVYLPDGRRDADTVGDWPEGFQGPPGYGDRFLTLHNRQRHLLQAGFVDRLVTRLLRRLRQTGMERRTAVVVVADHGVAWDLNVKDRRRVDARNIDEIAPIPLFIKGPGQRRGRIDRSLVRTLDVLPTLARLMRIRIPWRVAGSPAGSRQVRARRIVRMLSRNHHELLRISGSALRKRRAVNVRRWLRIFGTGSWERIFRFGPRQELLGQDPAALPAVPAGGLSASFRGDDQHLRDWQPSQPVAPIWLAGSIGGGPKGASRDVAAAVNGRIRAVGRSFHLQGRREEFFSLLYPERYLLPGDNRVELYEVLSGPRLRPLGGIG